MTKLGKFSNDVKEALIVHINGGGKVKFKSYGIVNSWGGSKNIIQLERFEGAECGCAVSVLVKGRELPIFSKNVGTPQQLAELLDLNLSDMMAFIHGFDGIRIERLHNGDPQYNAAGMKIREWLLETYPGSIFTGF